MSKRRALILFLVMAVSLLGLFACSTRQIVDLALSKHPDQMLKSMAESRAAAYKYNPELALTDIKRVKQEFDRLMGNLQKESGAQWGKKEAEVLPTKTRYVKYTEQYKNRVVVDYDAGTILIEHLDGDKAREKLRNAAVIALLTPDDPSAVDLFSDKEIELTGNPYLQELVVDQNRAVIKTRADVERYADYLVTNQVKSRTIDANGSNKTVLSVQMSMVNSHLDKRALQYATTVRKHSEQSKIPRSLIFAVIKTESAFNPYAVSSAPAFGMMQLVPSSGGREAYRKAKGEDKMPTKEYLFDADNNIELGSTYLDILLNDTPLNRINNPVSREYCAIAGYNTGPGNVYRAFSSLSGRARQEEALNKINAMTPQQVYEALRTKLPYEETRGYIVKVVAAKKQYMTM